MQWRRVLRTTTAVDADVDVHGAVDVHVCVGDVLGPKDPKGPAVCR
jgi:hypothetical protein